MQSELAEFWSKAAPDYDRVVELQIGPGTRAALRERLAKEERLGRVVEFGCGSGFFTEALASKADSLVATDFSPGMLDLARQRIGATNVVFREEDCQQASFEAAVFDTAFIGLLLQFTNADKTIAEMQRVLKSGGLLIIANLDVLALDAGDRFRCLFRVVHQGRRGYRRRPPRGFGRNVVGEAQLCELLARHGFNVLDRETMRNTVRSSYIPLNYIRAEKK